MPKTGQDLINDVRNDLDEFSPQAWSDTALLEWLNKGLTRVALRVREQREHWLDRIILSTDSPSTIREETYTPSTSLKATVNGTTLTLPPNCIEVVKILPTDTALIDRGIQFISKSQSSIEFNRAQRESNLSSAGTYYYDMRGKSTLVVAPYFTETFDISLQYVALPDIITADSTVPTMFDEMLDAVVLYAHARALQAIKHADYTNAYKLFKEELNDLLSLTRPRESSNPLVVEGVFDDYDNNTTIGSYW